MTQTLYLYVPLILLLSGCGVFRPAQSDWDRINYAKIRCDAQQASGGKCAGASDDLSITTRSKGR